MIRLAKKIDKPFEKIFSTPEEAIAYFTSKYGDDFVFSREFVYEKREVIQQYLLILDKEIFQKMQDKIKRQKSTLLRFDDPEVPEMQASYQGINIWESGRVQII